MHPIGLDQGRQLSLHDVPLRLAVGGLGDRGAMVAPMPELNGLVEREGHAGLEPAHAASRERLEHPGGNVGRYGWIQLRGE